MKVLMLGWEYPPHFSGGLGVATSGLARALSQYADLQVVLPHGVTHIQEGIEQHATHTELVQSETQHVYEQAISAYSSYDDIKSSATPISKKVKKRANNIRQSTAAKKNQTLYGDALMEKVEDYAKEAQAIAKKSDFDVIHAHDWMTFPAAIKIQQDSGKPLVIHVHSLETDRTTNPLVRNPIYKIEQQAIAKADLVIPVSEYTKESIEQHYGEVAKKVSSIHNGVSFQFDEATIGSPTRKKKKKKKDIKTVLFVGRLTAQKGVQTFVRTAAKLLENRKNIRFVLAGLGDQLEEMMQLVEDADIEDYVDFRGFVEHDELKKLLADADLLFMPSVSEPFGLAALEAAQFGLPIVISNQSGVIEVLPGVLTAEYWDSKTFARHIKVLLDYKSIRKAFGKANRKAVKHRSWHKVARKVMEAYENLKIDGQD